MVAAFIYGEYGSGPFSTGEIREIANKYGVTIPSRPDVTFRQKTAKRGGKLLFKPAGRGRFRPTVEAEKYFKATYKMIKGRKPRPENES